MMQMRMKQMERARGMLLSMASKLMLPISTCTRRHHGGTTAALQLSGADTTAPLSLRAIATPQRELPFIGMSLAARTKVLHPLPLPPRV